MSISKASGSCSCSRWTRSSSDHSCRTMIAPYRPQHMPSNFLAGYLFSYGILNKESLYGNYDKGHSWSLVHLPSHERYTFIRTKISRTLPSMRSVGIEQQRGKASYNFARKNAKSQVLSYTLSQHLCTFFFLYYDYATALQTQPFDIHKKRWYNIGELINELLSCCRSLLEELRYL